MADLVDVKKLSRLLLSLALGAPSLLGAPPLLDAQNPPVPGGEGRPQEPFQESLQVQLVELYVSVTDGDGDPVRGLEIGDFTVREDGRAQKLEEARDATDLPITLGLAVDSSASMFVKLPSVVRAARGLVTGLAPGRDRAFLVGFGPEPRLVQGTTASLGRVATALRYLEPDGRTPLWESIDFSLRELEGVPGRRALVVFFDGADDDGRRAYRNAFDRAEKVGVPIYLIIMNNEAARTEGQDFQTRAFISRLDRLAGVAGGEVYYVPTKADLTPIYQQIERELRSYYLLTYYPREPLEPGRRRQVSVEVPGRELEVRTINGYDPGRLGSTAYREGEDDEGSS